MPSSGNNLSEHRPNDHLTKWLIKHLLLGILFFTILCAYPSSLSYLPLPVEAYTPPEAPKPLITASSSVPMLIDYYSAKYALTPAQHKMMYDTVWCESKFIIDTQSFSITKSGKREDSWGLVQIHLPSHPNISREQAINPDFALDFMAHEFKKGNAKIWSCYKMLYPLVE